MAKLTKNRKAVLSKYDSEKEYSLEDAAKVMKEITFTKFDASVDVDIRLGVDPKKSDQMVRGVVSLPHGLGKVVRVLVLCSPDKAQEAKDAGAEHRIIGARRNRELERLARASTIRDHVHAVRTCTRIIR